jgi:hypothetical protein
MPTARTKRAWEHGRTVWSQACALNVLLDIYGLHLLWQKALHPSSAFDGWPGGASVISDGNAEKRLAVRHHRFDNASTCAVSVKKATLAQHMYQHCRDDDV